MGTGTCGYRVSDRKYSSVNLTPYAMAPHRGSGSDTGERSASLARPLADAGAVARPVLRTGPAVRAPAFEPVLRAAPASGREGSADYSFAHQRSRDADEHASRLSEWNQTYEQLTPGPFEGFLVEALENLFGRFFKLRLNLLADLFVGERGHAVLKRLEFFDEFGRDEVGTGREDLAQFHEGGP